MRNNALEREILISLFDAGINSRIAAGAVPQCMKNNPLLIGQVAHEVIAGCAVYLMSCQESGSGVQYLKIGLARNIKKRMETIAGACPLKIEKALYFCVGPFGRTLALEQKLHAKFADLRVTGEWFRFEDQQHKVEQVEKILSFVEAELAENFNSFLFDPALSADPDLPVVLEFAQTVWALTSEKIGSMWIEEAFEKLRPEPGWKTPSW